MNENLTGYYARKAFLAENLGLKELAKIYRQMACDVLAETVKRNLRKENAAQQMEASAQRQLS